MKAIRQLIEVKDNSFQVILPKGFKAKRVEVIIFPSDESLDETTRTLLDDRLKDYYENPDNVIYFEALLTDLESKL